MEAENTKSILRIEPKQKPLTVTELINGRTTTTNNPETQIDRCKRVACTGDPEEKKELEALYSNMKFQLAQNRIDRVENRCVAEWDGAINAACILRSKGKLDGFGFSSNGKVYLTAFESLFLMETDRLQLQNYSIPLSIEQAYLLLLGEEASKEFDEYLVYSHLSRVGYRIVPYRNEYLEQQHRVTDVDCIWACLDSALKNERIQQSVSESVLLKPIQDEFEAIKKCIRNQLPIKEDPISLDDDVVSISDILPQESVKSQTKSLKRKEIPGIQDSNVVKKPKICLANSFLDDLKDDEEYNHFKSFFEKLEIIKLDPFYSLPCSDGGKKSSIFIGRKLEISFDLHMRCKNNSKSNSHFPHLRVIVMRPNEKWPSIAEIHECYANQKYKIPLLVVAVNESKQINALLYYWK